MTLTENNSATFVSTGNPCLDFFFHVVPNTPKENITERLTLAWNHDPLITLKLICNLRGVRGTGKSDKEGYYTAALWLHKLHPKTLSSNVGTMADFGYFKDLPEILYRLMEGDDVRKRAKEERNAQKTRLHGRGFRGRHNFREPFGFGGRRNSRAPFGFGEKKKNKGKGLRNAVSTEERALAELKKVQIEVESARKIRDEKKIEMAKRAVERYNRDPDFKFLHDRVCDFFADCLRKDMELLNSGNGNKITLAAKWCPSLDSSFDKSTLLCESIARKVFPRAEYKEYEGIEDEHYAYRVRDRLRKEVLVPLRKVLELPEVYMGANDWGSLPYNRVASVAMKNYKAKFLKHDKERFEEYLEKVKEGKAKIAAGALLPHEIIGALGDEDGGQVAELQWKRMVEDLSEKGKLKNCLAVCDVSGSMCGIPMEVSVALGILVSELSEDPWKGILVTFSANPKLQMVVGDNLRAKANFVRNMKWGMNTDFQKVFDLILEVAVKGKLTEEQMIKKVIVFSDMEFDEASANPWETDYMMIVKKFTEKGYGNCVPQIVFWNLRDSIATPVPGNQDGVALVSGFSKNLLTLFLDENGVLNPEAVMHAAIAGEEYNKLAPKLLTNPFCSILTLSPLTLPSKAPPQTPIPFSEQSRTTPDFVNMASQSDSNNSAFSAPEMEFLAEDELIEIVPNMRMDTLNLICGDFGPFYPQIATQVPLWLAVALKKRGKCTIRPPEWMSVEKLTPVLEAERDSQTFQPLPFHYVEISRLLFDHAREDIQDMYMVRSLIEDIKDVRFHKTGTGLEIITKERTSALRLKHLSAMEANLVRPFVTKALETFSKLHSPELIQDPGRVPTRQPQAANRGQRRPLKDR
ncbi:hypothetical protein LIER_19143 [Lithospermum erythrorhizon]|uniref:DNA replication complex GINS protein PSF2 n=1 Tax=Lithospermum erythrorhizon TaxID=34254 RepID=A0AAV3QJ89_LITER